MIGLRRIFCLFVLSVLIFFVPFGAGRRVFSGEHLWDQEPSLWELAKGYTQSHRLSRIDPQPLGGYRSGATSIPRLSTQELKISLWGPPSQVTLSLGKTDVWDRRCFQDPLLTIGQIRQMVTEGKTPPYGSDGWRAYDCPEPSRWVR